MDEADLPTLWKEDSKDKGKEDNHEEKDALPIAIIGITVANGIIPLIQAASSTSEMWEILRRQYQTKSYSRVIQLAVSVVPHEAW